MRRKKATSPHAALPPRASTITTPPRLPRATIAQPAAPTTVPARAASSPLTRWTLVISDGTQVPISGTGIIGRTPHTDEGYTHVIRLDDPARMLSRNHLAFGLTPEHTPWVSDLQSANGTYLDDEELTPGIRTQIHPGQTLRFGDHHARIVIG